jgi:nitrogen fixation NifU-like protein
MSKSSDYFFDTHHAGELDQNDSNVYCAEVGSEKQNNLLRLYVRCENQQIVDAKFQAFGTPAVMASCEYVCRWLMGKTLVEAKQLTAEQIMQALEISSLQIHVAVLVERLVKTTLDKCG